MQLTDTAWRTSTYSGSNGGECVEVTVIFWEQPWS